MKLAEIQDLSDQELYELAAFIPLKFDDILGAEIYHGLHDPANLDARVKWVACLREAVAPRCPKNKMGTAIISDINLLQATARERLLAFILWKHNHYKP
jgi:hypothetical protein